MAETELTRQIGARMKAAAKAKDMTQIEVSERMSCNQTMISRWFAGQTTPEPHEMRLYAEMVGVSEGWLWTGREDLTPNRLADMLADCLLRVKRGEAPSAAFDAMTHEPWHLTPERRRVVDAAADQIRDYVARNVAGWESLSEHEQRQALLRLLAPSL